MPRDQVISISFSGKMREDLPQELLSQAKNFVRIVNLRRNRDGELESRLIYRPSKDLTGIIPDVPVTDNEKVIKIWNKKSSNQLLAITNKSIYSNNKTQGFWSKLSERTNQKLNVYSVTQKEKDLKNIAISKLGDNNLIIFYTFQNEIFFKVFSLLENRIIGKEEKVIVGGIPVGETITGLASEEIGPKLWVGILTSERIVRVSFRPSYDNTRIIDQDTDRITNLNWRLGDIIDTATLVEKSIKKFVFYRNRMFYEKSNGEFKSSVIDLGYTRFERRLKPGELRTASDDAVTSIIDPTETSEGFNNKTLHGFRTWNEFTYQNQRFKLIWSEQTGYFLLNDRNIIVGHYFANFVPLNVSNPPRMAYYGRAIEVNNKVYIPILFSGQLEVESGGTHIFPLGIKLLCFDFNSDIPPSIAELGNQTIIGGPVLSYFDGQGVSEHGFSEKPNIEKTNNDDYDKWAYGDRLFTENEYGVKVPFHELPTAGQLRNDQFGSFNANIERKNSPFTVESVDFNIDSSGMGTFESNSDLATKRLLRYSTNTSDGTSSKNYGTLATITWDNTKKAVVVTFTGVSAPSGSDGHPEGIVVDSKAPVWEFMKYTLSSTTLTAYHYPRDGVNPFKPSTTYKIEVPLCNSLQYKNSNSIQNPENERENLIVVGSLVQVSGSENNMTNIAVNEVKLRGFKRVSLSEQPRAERTLQTSGISYGKLNHLDWRGAVKSSARSIIGIPDNSGGTGVTNGTIINPSITSKIDLVGIFKRGNVGGSVSGNITITSSDRVNASFLSAYNGYFYGWQWRVTGSGIQSRTDFRVFRSPISNPSAMTPYTGWFRLSNVPNDRFPEIRGFAVSNDKIYIIASHAITDRITLEVWSLSANPTRERIINLPSGSRIAYDHIVTDGTNFFLRERRLYPYDRQRIVVLNSSGSQIGTIPIPVGGLAINFSYFILGDNFFTATVSGGALACTAYNKTTFQRNEDADFSLSGVGGGVFARGGRTYSIIAPYQNNIYILTNSSNFNIAPTTSIILRAFGRPDTSEVTGVGRNLNLVLSGTKTNYGTKEAFESDVKSQIAKFGFTPSSTGEDTEFSLPSTNVTEKSDTSNWYLLYNLDTNYSGNSILKTIVDSENFGIKFLSPSGVLHNTREIILAPSILSVMYNTDKKVETETIIKQDLIAVNSNDENQTNQFVLNEFRDMKDLEPGPYHYYRRTSRNPLEVNNEIFNFLMPPENIVFRYVFVALRPTLDQLLTAHVYRYVCRFKWLDENGLEFRSPLSEEISIFTNSEIGLAGNRPTFDISYLNLTNKSGGVSIEIYRTMDKRNTFRLMKEIKNEIGIEKPQNPIIDDVEDRNLGAVLTPERWHVSGADHVITYRNRFVLYGFPEFRNRFVVSSRLQTFTNRGVTFYRSGIPGDAIEIRMSSNINCIQQMDQTLIIFCEDGVYSWIIDETSQLQDEPQKVTSLTNITAKNGIAIVEISKGLLLLTNFRGIWGITRNQGIHFFGQAIQDFKGDFRDQPLQLETAEEVRWCTTDQDRYPLICHDYRHDDWFIDDVKGIVSHTIYEGRYTIVKSNGQVLVETEDPKMVKPIDLRL